MTTAFEKDFAYALMLFVYDRLPIILNLTKSIHSPPEYNRGIGPFDFLLYQKEYENEFLNKMLKIRQKIKKNVKLLYSDDYIAIIQLSNDSIMYINLSDSDYNLHESHPYNYLNQSDLEIGEYYNFSSNDSLYISNKNSNPTYNMTTKTNLVKKSLFIFIKNPWQNNVF